MNRKVWYFGGIFLCISLQAVPPLVVTQQGTFSLNNRTIPIAHGELFVIKTIGPSNSPWKFIRPLDPKLIKVVKKKTARTPNGAIAQELWYLRAINSGDQIVGLSQGGQKIQGTLVIK